MKTTPALFRFGLLAVLAMAPVLRAADAEPAKSRNGYTVTLDIKVDEQGKPEGVSVVSTDDESAGEIMSKMAIAMAMKTTFPPRQKDGVAHKYTARAPFFFPIEDDEGKESNQVPKPTVKNVVQPVYPLDLREKDVVGGAIFELLIDANGKLTGLKTLRASHPEFEKAGRESLQKWEFSAAKKEGQPVESRSRIAIVFETAKEMADLKWRIPPRPSLGSFTVIKPDHPITDAEAAAAGVPVNGADKPAPATEPKTESSPTTTPPPPGK